MPLSSVPTVLRQLLLDPVYMRTIIAGGVLVAYQIQYGTDAVRTELCEFNKSTRKGKIRASVILIFILSGLLISQFDSIYNLLIPGNKEVTIAATRSMIENVQTGESVVQAFTSFCMEIIGSANLDG